MSLIDAHSSSLTFRDSSFSFSVVAIPIAMETPQSRLFEALIFDMDGVLIDSEPLHERAKREALSEAGIIVPESLFASYTGRSDKAMIYEVAAGHGLNEQRSAEILSRKHRIYESLEHTLRPVPGCHRVCALGKISLSTCVGYIRDKPQSQGNTEVASDRIDV